MKRCRLHIVCLLALFCAACAEQPAPDATTPESRAEAPGLRIECSHLDDRAFDRYPWHLSIEPSGDATLTVLRPTEDGHPRTVRYSVRDKMPRIEQVIRECRAFDLPEFIGELNFHRSTRRIDIRSDGKAMSVLIFPMTPSGADDAARRAVKLWAVIEDCVQDPDALEAPASDRQILQQMELQEQQMLLGKALRRL